MRADWFRPRRLARRLAADEVPNREVAYIMLSNLVFTSLIFYGAFTWANPPWSLPSLIEGITVLVITFIGFTKVYDAAGGDKNQRFAVLFNFLSFGVWFWSTVIVWVVFWAAVWVYQYGILSAYRFHRNSLAQGLLDIGGGYEWVWTFIAAVCWQVLFFSWLARVIPRPRSDA